MRPRPRWPIEAVAMRLMTDTIRETMGEKLTAGGDKT